MTPLKIQNKIVFNGQTLLFTLLVLMKSFDLIFFKNNQALIVMDGVFASGLLKTVSILSFKCQY